MCRCRASTWLVKALVFASAGVVESSDWERITPEILLAGDPFGSREDTIGPVSGEEVLWVSPEMREFLEGRVDRRASPEVRLHQLTSAIIGRRVFGLRFDSTTRTASETFRARTGNCLSFSNMFVALAREVGLDASFQEVDIPPDWSLQDDVFVLNRHVNVRVSVGPAGERVIDFNIDDFRASYDARTITDAEALAHYFNNVGVEKMQSGDAASAIGCFRKAISNSDRRFSPAWTNLGTLYFRHGHASHAEAAYRQALRADRGDLVAMSNLAGLFDLQGEPELADRYRKRVDRHRNRNPYYRYQRAREAFAAGEWDAAVDHLLYAIRRKRDEAKFCDLLSRCFAEKGDERRARRWRGRAESLASGGTGSAESSSRLRGPSALGGDGGPERATVRPTARRHEWSRVAMTLSEVPHKNRTAGAALY